MVGLPVSRPTEAAATTPLASPATTSGAAVDSVRTIGRGAVTVYDTSGAGQGSFAGSARLPSSKWGRSDTFGRGVP